MSKHAASPPARRIEGDDPKKYVSGMSNILLRTMKFQVLVLTKQVLVAETVNLLCGGELIKEY
jgi:hypothetical protein